jgi:hypothetical protein
MNIGTHISITPMPHIKVSIPNPASDDRLIHGRATHVEIDGKECPDVRSLSLHFDVDSVVSAKMEMFVRSPFVFEGAVWLNVTALLSSDFEIVRETLPDGRLRWFARPRTESNDGT